ncbi:hypothetical protein [Acidisphaera sp. L21]|uniref:hypothetical protein n=1 Tax=Acidisphaera sp. L21 TaxID=1641851 RepID=UPI00131AB45B|nr:hypothetical protein [Acidisphaera sp. L21]
MNYGSLVFAAPGIAAVSSPAVADELVARKPGIMCKSPEILGKLTLSDGDSRTHAHPGRSEDLAAASAGGCIDIPPAAVVSVQRSYKNTSVVLYPSGIGDAYTVPNIDFAHANDAEGSSTSPNGIPAGYHVAEQIPAGMPNGETFVILEDSGISSAMRKQMWGQADDPDILFDPGSSQAREFAEHPFRNARLRLVDPSGAVAAEKAFTEPLAEIKPAPLRGMPAPTFFLTVDYSTGAGGFSGPDTTILVPSAAKLEPLHYLSDYERKSVEINLAQTLHAGWKVVAGRSGADEIEVVGCRGNGGRSRSRSTRPYGCRVVSGSVTHGSKQTAERSRYSRIGRTFPNR